MDMNHGRSGVPSAASTESFLASGPAAPIFTGTPLAGSSGIGDSLPWSCMGDFPPPWTCTGDFSPLCLCGVPRSLWVAVSLMGLFIEWDVFFVSVSD